MRCIELCGVVDLNCEDDGIHPNVVLLKETTPYTIVFIWLTSISIVIYSVGFTDEVVGFTWRKHQPVRFNKNIHLTQFSFEEVPTIVECEIDFDIVGTFSCLEARIHLERKFGYYFLQIYLPSMLVVCLSWVSFWLPSDTAPARVSIGIITVLTLATHSAKARDNLPHVSYVTGIDVWMSVCTTFVFLAMVEYAVVSMMYRTTRNAKSGVNSGTQEGESTTGYQHFRNSCTLFTDEQVDIFCRICFPSVFLVFQIIYWLYYLVPPSPTSEL